MVCLLDVCAKASIASQENSDTIQPVEMQIEETNNMETYYTMPLESEKTFTEEEKRLLQDRRDTAEAYMRSMANVLWRATEDLTWTTKHHIVNEELLAEYCLEKRPLKMCAGRLYRGIPYSFSGCSPYTFFKFLGGKDEKGHPKVEGLHWRNLNGGAKSTGRIGNDCSSAVQQSWMFVGGNFAPAGTGSMVASLGYIPVGSYKNEYTQYEDTTCIVAENGNDVMFASYAELRNADAIVRRQDNAGHTMMITSVNVVYDENGAIDGEKSYVTVVHQTAAYTREQAFEYDEAIGENVYKVYGIDDVFTFNTLIEKGYLPVTCDVLIDPGAKPKEVWIKDSVTEYSFDNILEGEFTSNEPMSFVNIVITDQKGLEVGNQVCFYIRQSERTEFKFQMRQFVTETDFNKLGTLDLNKLTPGTYHCTHTLTGLFGSEYVMRDFDFTIE